MVGTKYAVCRPLYGVAVTAVLRHVLVVIFMGLLPVATWAQDGGVAILDGGDEAFAPMIYGEAVLGDAGVAENTSSTSLAADGGVVEDDFQPPVALTNTQVRFPKDAPRIETPQSVIVILHIDEKGDVAKVELMKSMGPPFDQAVLAASKDFKFQPGFFKGIPVGVKMEFSQTFVSPPLPKYSSRIEGIILERGTQLPVAFAELTFVLNKKERTVMTDGEGAFTLEAPAKPLNVTIYADGFGRFLQRLYPKKGEALQVKFLLDRDEDLSNAEDPYVTRVKKKRIRTETVRQTLTGDEMRHIPGTFGDPYRAVSNLPGITETSAFLPLPLIRGSSPGSTGILFDGMRLPYLFHLLPGPTVMHPRIIDSIDFYPGAFPLRFGGYTAGIVDGQSYLMSREKNTTEIDINAIQTGFFGDYQLGDSGVSMQLGGRYGYPAALLNLIDAGIRLGYWDYQGRLDYGPKTSHWTLTSFGASDDIELETDDPDGEVNEETGLVNQVWKELFRMDFHRLDLRYFNGNRKQNGDYRIALGYDRTRFDGADYGVESPIVHPRATWRLPVNKELTLNLGTEIIYREISYNEAPQDEAGLGVVLFNSVFEQAAGTLVQGGVFTETEWQINEDFLVVGGARGEIYHHRDKEEFVFDPRLTMRYRLHKGPELTTWIFGGTGLYHQPPRLFLPFPGVDHSGIENGLLESVQNTIGAEIDISEDIAFQFQTYYHHMNPVFFELAVNPTFESLQSPIPEVPPGEPQPQQQEEEEPSLLDTFRKGRAYGIEFLLRKRISEGYFGWIAYSLGHSERLVDAVWVPYDFNRTHVLKVVGGKRLPRNWSVSGRVSYMSGTPLTTAHGYNAGTKPNNFRVDIRFDKRVVWDQWLFEYYVDLANASVTPQDFGFGIPTDFPYILPTIGLKAIF